LNKENHCRGVCEWRKDILQLLVVVIVHRGSMVFVFLVFIGMRRGRGEGEEVEEFNEEFNEWNLSDFVRLIIAIRV
jgi:hypothetical protein